MLAGVTAGVITSAGGEVSVVVANTSSNIDSSTGDTRFDNADATFVGQAVGGATTVTGLAEGFKVVRSPRFSKMTIG